MSLKVGEFSQNEHTQKSGPRSRDYISSKAIVPVSPAVTSPQG